MKKSILILIILFLSTNCCLASDKVYSWVDDEGVHHFSDTPTYGVEQESKGTAHFLIDRHGRKIPIKTQKKIGIDSIEKTPVNKAIVQKTKSRFKSGSGQLDFNFFDLFVSFLPALYPIFLIIILLGVLKLANLYFYKSLKFKWKTFIKEDVKEEPTEEVDQKSDEEVKGDDFDSDWCRPNTKSSEFKGFEGEQIIIDLLYRFLDRKKYHFYNDLIIPDNEGTTQIDHLVISKYGLFIVETKNMRGSIYGNPYQKTWTQWLADGKHPFQNPFHQNYKHKKCLEKLLAIETNVYFDVIVFIDGAKFPKGKPENVYYPNEFIQFVNSQNEVILSENEIKKVLSAIESSMLKPSFETDKRHREHVKRVLRKG